MSKSYEEQMALKARLEQAKQKTLKSAIGFAMAQEDFDAKECLIYLDLGFREDNVDVFKACSSWLSKHGALSDLDAKSWAMKSFYEQKPYALAMVAHAFPSAIEQEYDGIDIWMNGLSMSLVHGDESSAMMLAHALGKSDQSGVRIHQSIDKAFDLLDRLPPDAEYYQKKPIDGHAARLLAAKCEQAFLAATVASAKSKGPGPLTL